MSEASDDERRPLLSREEGDPLQASSDAATAVGPSCRHRCQGCFLVEPILVLFALGIFPLSIISQKYTLDWYQNDSSVDFDVHGQNDSHANTSASSCHENASRDDNDQLQEYAQKRASMFALYSSLVMGVPAVFVTVILGAGSDRFGRRFAVIPPVFGVFASSLISTVVILTESRVYWLFLASFVSGCTGSFMSILMACFAYVVDRSPPERRLFRILVVEMSLLISGIVSPIINGAVVTRFGYFYPLLFVVAASVLNLIYVVAFFPKKTRQDNLPPALSSSMDCQPTLTSFLPVIWQQICSMFRIFFKNSPHIRAASRWRRLRLNLLMVAFFITNLPTLSLSVSTLFEMNHPLCWDVNMVGLFVGLSSAISGVGAVIVTPLFKLCHTPDVVIAIISSLASLATNVYTIFVRSTVMMFLTLSVAMLRILFTPSLRTLLSKEVGDEEQGSLFGAISCLEVICMTIGTVMFNSIYSATLFISTGFVFLVMAAFYLVGCILVGTYAILTKVDKRNSSRSDAGSKTLGDVLQ